MTKLPILRCATIWLISLVSLFPCLCLAQDATGAPDAEAEGALELEEIIVTGTRIVRRDFTAPSPVATMDEDAIRSSAQPTLDEALNRMPQVKPSFGRTSNNPGTGQSEVNLRGMGSNRTLVMLNGRRFAPAGIGNSVDVNTIPQALIERIEIVTGGASTVYGSDAIAGVVNFLTRNDFDGIEFEASAYITAESDSEIYDANVAWGRNFESGLGNFAVFVGYLERKALFAGDREISAVALGEDFAGNIVPQGSPSIPAGMIASPLADLGNGPTQVMFTPDGQPVPFVDPDDRYDFAPINYLQIPLQREYGGFFLNYQFGTQSEIYFEGIFTRNDVRQSLAEVPIFGLPVEVNIDNPVLTPETRQLFADNYTPPGSDVASFIFFRRLVEFGPRILNKTNDYFRLLAGLRGNLTDTWEYDVWVTYTDVDEDEEILNDASATRFLQGLLVDPVTGQCFDPSGGCVPINPFGAGNLSDEAVAFVRIPAFTNPTTREQMLASAFVRGEPLNTWAGPVAVVLGAEWRRDSGALRANEVLFTGDSLGFFPFSGVDGEESVSELYAETLIPLADGAPFAEHLELEVGGRLSEYDHAGSTDSYKIGGAWEPVGSLRFRTMFQRSVRAPDLSEAFQEQIIRQGTFVGQTFVDPCSASQDPAGRGIADRCIAQGIPAEQIGVFEATPFFPADFISGGNPNLEPEIGETITVGLVYNGLDQWVLSLDYFDLQIEDTIGSADVPSVCFNPDNTAAVLCDQIRRDPATFNVIEVDETNSNLGKLQTKGFDFQASYATELPNSLAIDGAFASLTVDVIWTHLTSLSFQDNLAVEPFDCLGVYGFPCDWTNVGEVSPENTVTVFSSYSSGKLDLHVTARWLEGTDNRGEFVYENIFGIPGAVVATPPASSKTYFDLGIGYRFTDTFEARLDIANLFETDPPLTTWWTSSNNTDAQTFDVFGRAYQLALSFRY